MLEGDTSIYVNFMDFIMGDVPYVLIYAQRDQRLMDFNTMKYDAPKGLCLNGFPLTFCILFTLAFLLV